MGPKLYALIKKFKLTLLVDRKYQSWYVILWGKKKIQEDMSCVTTNILQDLECLTVRNDW